MSNKIVPLSDAAKRNAVIRREHAEKLAVDKVYLVCYECLIDGWTSENEIPYEGVMFYPSQQETFATVIRRSGPDTTELLRKKLSDPAKCRLLCPLHMKRAKSGWSARREALYRMWDGIAVIREPYEIIAPNGKTVRIDEYGLGPYTWPAEREARKQARAEWFDTSDGGPPDLD